MTSESPFYKIQTNLLHFSLRDLHANGSDCRRIYGELLAADEAVKILELKTLSSKLQVFRI